MGASHALFKVPPSRGHLHYSYCQHIAMIAKIGKNHVDMLRQRGNTFDGHRQGLPETATINVGHQTATKYYPIELMETRRLRNQTTQRESQMWDALRLWNFRNAAADSRSRTSGGECDN